MKKIFIGILIAIILSIFITGCKVERVIKLQIISRDIQGKEKVEKTINVKANDEVDLEKYYGNNIKILEVNDKNVKILWTKTIYSDGPDYRSTTIDEEKTLKYNQILSISNTSPLAGQAKYYYYIKFIK